MKILNMLVLEMEKRVAFVGNLAICKSIQFYLTK